MKKAAFAVFPILPTIVLCIVLIIAAFAHANNNANQEPENRSESEIKSVEETEGIDVTDFVVEDETKTQLTDLGTFRITAYCPCEVCCGKWALNRPIDESGEVIVYTASMTRAKANWTIAADTSILPFGTRVVIDGKEYEVQDRGGAIKGNKIDIYFDSHEEALQFGVQYKNIFLLA